VLLELQKFIFEAELVVVPAFVSKFDLVDSRVHQGVAQIVGQRHHLLGLVFPVILLLLEITEQILDQFVQHGQPAINDLLRVFDLLEVALIGLLDAALHVFEVGASAAFRRLAYVELLRGGAAAQAAVDQVVDHH
jgi:hypothetical protein